MKGRAYMVMIEPHETEVLFEALLLLRKDNIEQMGSVDNRVDVLLYNIATHAGIQVTKQISPEAYEIVFPEGPPRIVGKYGATHEGAHHFYK